MPHCHFYTNMIKETIAKGICVWLIMFVLVITFNANAIPESKLIALYCFEDNNATYASDCSGHGLYGTLVNSPAYVASKGGNATGDYSLMFTPIEFVGGTQINTGQNFQLDSTSAWTIGYWTKAYYAPDGYWVYSKWGTGGGIAFSVDYAGLTAVEMLSLTGEITVISNETLGFYEWHHQIISYDGSDSSNGVTIYNDGVLTGNLETNNYPTGSILNADDGIMGGSNPFFSYGEIDEFFVLNQSITDDEAMAIYNYGIESIITQPPVIPSLPNTTLKMNSCPDTIPNVMLLWLVIAVAFVLIIIGAAFRNSIVGILGSLLLTVSSLYLMQCESFASYIIAGSGIVMMAYFIFGLFGNKERDIFSSKGGLEP